MSHCVFCSSCLTVDTKPEHILLDALGGRMKVRDADCSACNERFGGTIDSVFAAQVIPLRNALQLRSGSGDPPPGLPKVQAGNQTIRIESDGTIRLRGKPFAIDKRPDGSWDLRIHASSDTHIQSLLPGIAVQLGISIENLRAQLLATGTVAEQKLYIDEVGHTLVPGGPEALRSMMKSALILWCGLVGNDEVSSEPYKSARDFVTNGDKDFNLTRTCLDMRRLPFETAAKAAFGPLFNLIYISSDDVGRVIGHFTLYNFVGWRFVLAEQDGSPNLRTALISNPENPRDWSAEAAAQFDLPLTWLDQPETNLDLARERLIDLGRHHKKVATERAISRIVDEVTIEFGICPNQPISPDKIEAFSSLASWRVAHLLARMPESQRLTPDAIAKLLGEA